MSRKKGSGTVYQDKKTGIYYLRIVINGKSIIKSLKTKSAKQAKTNADNYIKDNCNILNAKTKEEVAVQVLQARKLLTQQDRIKLEDSWDQYLKSSLRPDSGKATLRGYESYWNRFIEFLPSDILYLDEITEKHANDFMSMIGGSKISSSTYNATLQGVKLVFKILSNSDISSPLRNIQKRTKQQISRKEFTKEQILSIFSALNSKKLYLLNKEEMRLLFHIGVWTGLRLKDCALIKWENVNLKSNLITVVPYKTSRKSNIHVTIPIHPDLRLLLDIAHETKMNEFVLPSIAERYLYNPYGVGKDCMKVLIAAGIQTKEKSADGKRARKVTSYGFHSFRHSFVSFCAEAGVPMATVQAIVGHSSPAMTRHYTHIGIQSLTKAVNSLEIISDKKAKPDLRQEVTNLLNKLPDDKLVTIYQYIKREVV